MKVLIIAILTILSLPVYGKVFCFNSECLVKTSDSATGAVSLNFFQAAKIKPYLNETDLVTNRCYVGKSGISKLLKVHQDRYYMVSLGKKELTLKLEITYKRDILDKRAFAKTLKRINCVQTGDLNRVNYIKRCLPSKMKPSSSKTYRCSEDHLE